MSCESREKGVTSNVPYLKKNHVEFYMPAHKRRSQLNSFLIHAHSWFVNSPSKPCSLSRGQWRGRKSRDARSAGTPGAFFDVTNRCMIRKKKIIWFLYCCSVGIQRNRLSFVDTHSRQCIRGEKFAHWSWWGHSGDVPIHFYEKDLLLCLLQMKVNPPAISVRQSNVRWTSFVKCACGFLMPWISVALCYITFSWPVLTCL